MSQFQRGEGQPGYPSLELDGCRLHLSSFPGDGSPETCVHIDLKDIYDLQSDLLDRGWPEDEVEVMVQDWGNREIYVLDPDGNTLRFGDSRAE